MAERAQRPDPVALEVWNNRFAEVAEEMGAALGRSALSPNIKERRDRSCAIFDAAGRMIAQAAHIPVHLGATPLSVRAAIAAVPMADGDCVILNDPFAGGTHLPDVTLVLAVDVPRAPGDDSSVRFHLACRAHHADVGGQAPGSFATATHAKAGELPEREEPVIAMGPKYRLGRSSPPRRALTIDDEGVRIPPRQLTDEVARWFASQSRTPAERLGDLAAQRACLEVGRRRLLSLCERHGAGAVAAHGEALRSYAARIMRGALAAIPAGVYAFADSLDDDGAGTEAVGIRVRLEIDGRGAARVDFSECDDESPGALNAVLAVTLSAVLYCFRLLCPDDTPTNEGLLEPIEVIAPAGTIVNARPPRAVAAGNVETSQRLVDVLLGALAQALPSRIPAASSGTMSNVMFGGVVSGEPFAYYETIAGGAGGSPDSDGARCIQTHMTNTWSTPAEALEHAAPVRVIRHGVRRGSGGAGFHRGGDGVERTIEFLAPATVTLVADRRRRSPYGLAGGGPGTAGEDVLERQGREVRLPSKCTFEAVPGDRLTIRTPGGGGWGDPRREHGSRGPR